MLQLGGNPSLHLEWLKKKHSRQEQQRQQELFKREQRDLKDCTFAPATIKGGRGEQQPTKAIWRYPRDGTVASPVALFTVYIAASLAAVLYFSATCSALSIDARPIRNPQHEL